MDLPFRAEYAKSGRAACKGCKTPISKDTLRLAVMVQSPMFDGKVPHWYHVSCFFAKQRVKSVGDVSHFESLRWEDQELIRSKVAGGPSGSSSGVSNGTSAGGSAKKASKRKGKSGLADFSIEYSKSSRATCRGCEDKIVKEEIRVSKKDFDSDEGRRYGGIDLWHHLECFSKVRQELEFWDSGPKLPGYKTLKKEDQDKVKKMLPQMEPIKVKKEESDVDGVEPPKKPKIESDNVMKQQNQMMFYYRDHLKLLQKKHLTALLEYNNQQVPAGTESMCDRLADAMTFGALLHCKECRHGQIVFRSGVGYFCLGNKDEWVKCEAVTDDPKRKPFRVPDDLKEKFEFLASYKYKPQKRIFQSNQPTVSNASVLSGAYAGKSMKSEPSTSGPRVIRDLPLKNIEVASLGKLPLNKEELKLKVMKLGGKLASKITDQTTVIIAPPDVFKGSSKFLKVAEENGIQIVPFEFLEECDKPGANGILNINKMNLATWGSDPSNRMNFDVVDSKSKSKSLSFSSGKYKSNLPSKVKLKVQDGVAVDPVSGLEDVAHVYRFNKDIYTTVLSLVDLQSGRNSYYKLQVLESNDKKTYWLFRSWGRVGTDIGGNKLEHKASREDAITEFEALFEDKTANMWRNRANFVKVPGKMNWVDISYDDESIDKSTLSAVPSKLPQPVQNLITLIFNVDTMKNVMLEFELDMEKMPLGKLSKKQMKKAFEVLTELQNCISASGDKMSNQKILGLTNQFYTLIPHSFGIDNPPLLNDLDTIKQKDEMLSALMEIEIAYSMLRDVDSDNKDVHAIDSYYLKLKADISPLNKTDQEFQTLQLYVQNTHAETHRNYDLEIMEIYKVERQGEHKRYKPFKKLHNRKLLWHGSRLTNFAGILSQGLRIAPPEAPVTGYMFGKGIYFADMVSKSANYCMTNYTNNTGMVLLCEVALGDMHELTHAQDIKKPPAGKHSVKGLGITEPAAHQSVVREDGVEIPLGKGIHTGRQTSLLYNEYIVYDVAQVKVEYLVQLKFLHK
ncbi:poly [ADP-ribose] polymerase [Planococcus citri]|uniref:poly [ADP-ribose] polymerase n=1 Tax=Planococcus citri TaxID=170843 RepID=UPI0031F8C473